MGKAIKIRVGKLEANLAKIDPEIPTNGFRYLEIEPPHTLKLIELPTFDDHNDPFDRLTATQSLAEPMLLLTSDEKPTRYGPTVHVIREPSVTPQHAGGTVNCATEVNAIEFAALKTARQRTGRAYSISLPHRQAPRTSAGRR